MPEFDPKQRPEAMRVLGCADVDTLAKPLMEAPDRDVIARHATQFSWEQTTQRYMSVLEEACEGTS